MKAFPNIQLTVSEMGQVRAINEVNAGMDLRDYFACAAMQSFLSFQDIGNMTVAKEAYMMADAMMEARDDNQ